MLSKKFRETIRQQTHAAPAALKAPSVAQPPSSAVPQQRQLPQDHVPEQQGQSQPAYGSLQHTARSPVLPHTPDWLQQAQQAPYAPGYAQLLQPLAQDVLTALHPQLSYRQPPACQMPHAGSVEPILLNGHLLQQPAHLGLPTAVAVPLHGGPAQARQVAIPVTAATPISTTRSCVTPVASTAGGAVGKVW